MRVLRVPFLVAFFCLSNSQPFAQGLSGAEPFDQMNAESLADEMKAFTEAHPDVLDTVKRPREGRVEIPSDVLEGIEFDFQERLAVAGHGGAWDSDGRPVRLKPVEAFELQEAMLEAIAKEQPRKDRDVEAMARLDRSVAEIDKVLNDDEIGDQDRFALRHLKLRAKAYQLNEARTNIYLWRTDYLWNAMVRDFQFGLDVRYIRLREDLIGLLSELVLRTDYMRQCAAAGVPIPPDFALSGTVWRRQGDLAAPLIVSGSRAQVYVWASPALRGGCVALPRGTGAPGTGDLAGIICQGADSGRACFWDSKRRGSGEIIPWRDETMVVRELMDANQLPNCTNCHRGNNVFIVSPDDRTWCRLMRGGVIGSGCAAITAANSQNFTLRVERPVNPVPVPGTSVVHPRYVPLSTQGWSNPASVGCAGICHLNSSGTPMPTPMPPLCGTSCYQ